MDKNNSTPEKWKKYEILMKYGLTTENVIRDQVNRYVKNDIGVVCSDIKKDMIKNPNEHAYIIKLVPLILKPKLKNFIIRTNEDIEVFSEKVLSFSGFEEIWWCKTKLSGGKAPDGRMYINNGSNTNDISQCVEQVWAETARKLEQIGSGVPYVVANRISWGFNYKIKSFNIGDEELHVFHIILKELETKKNNIQMLSDDLLNICIPCMSIEYKAMNGKVHIVDWDSSDDKKALNLL